MKTDNTGDVLLDVLGREVRGCGKRQEMILSLAELKHVMRLAKEHTVLGLVANAAVEGRLKIADDMSAEKQKAVMTLMQVNVMHQRSYFQFEKTIAEFAALMKKHSLRYVVFKGVAVARHYPVPYTRTMGDVDFYVPVSDFNRAVEVIERELHVEIEKEDIDKHYSFDFQGIRFEMHYQIETFGNGRHQRCFNRMIDGSIASGTDSFSIAGSKAENNGVDVSVLSPTEDLIVVFKHWFNHLLVEGVGLRQTTDLAVLLMAYRDKMDVALLMKVLKEIGYIKAFRAMLAMMHKYFGLSGMEDFCALKKQDCRYAEKLMAVVMKSGNFGRKAYKNHIAGKKKSVETATRALRHCVKFFWLAPKDILFLIPRRIGITLKPLLRATFGCFPLPIRRGE